MAMNHAVSELVCSLKNGQLARKSKIAMDFSGVKQAILDVLKKEGYIRDFNVVKGESFDTIEIDLAYHNGKAVIRDIQIISKPGKRKYSGIDEVPVINNGLGMVILSTSKGILPDHEAKLANVGGELLLKIF